MIKNIIWTILIILPIFLIFDINNEKEPTINFKCKEISNIDEDKIDLHFIMNKDKLRMCDNGICYLYECKKCKSNLLENSWIDIK